MSADERGRFIDEFSRNLRRGIWIMYGGLALALGGVVLFSALRGADLSQAAIFVGIGIVIIPYLFYNHWTWGAPARELAGRTPIAGPRSSEEVQRLRFGKMSYAQLGIAALAGLAMPFLAGGHDLFTGWNRLWLVFGAALALFVAVQAFRKWRFDQEDRLSNLIPPLSNPTVTEVTQDSASSDSKGQLWRFVPFAIIVLGGAFIAFTVAGKRLAQTPSFWPIVLIGFGAWALFTVAQGFSRGRIEPIVRGLHSTYSRDEQPKRFWASMVWNALLGGICLFASLSSFRDAHAQSVRDRCYNWNHRYPPQEAFSACDQLIARKASLGGWDRANVFLDRGIANASLGRVRLAVADYNNVIRLRPDYYPAYYDRALAEERIGDFPRALDDYGATIRLRPQYADSYYNRGRLLLKAGRLADAAADFSRAHEINPNDDWALANRGLAYALMKDAPRAEADFQIVEETDKSNAVMLRGRAVLSINALNMADAVNYLTASLKSDPDNVWSIRTRAWAYRQLGDDEHADADLKRYEELSARSALAKTPS